MMLLSFLIGTILTTIIGWVALRACEGKQQVLLDAERITLGFLLGTTLLGYWFFWTHLLLQLPLVLWGFSVSYILLLCALLPIWYLQTKGNQEPKNTLAPQGRLSPKMKIVFSILGVWLLLKLIAGSSILLFSPPYHDDVINNWNYRGKIYYYQQEFTLEMAEAYRNSRTDRISSYPPAFSLNKTWWSTIAGTWNDGLVGSMHILWYIALLSGFYFALRRYANLLWSLTGTYILGSMPLLYMHAIIPYADLYLCAHLFIAVSMLHHGLLANTRPKRLSYFAISALAMGLLTFTKTEGFILYIAPLALGIAYVCWQLQKEGERTMLPKTLGLYALSALVLIAPWQLYKMTAALPMIKAKNFLHSFGWQDGVVEAVYVTTFSQANWAFLFPLLLVTFVLERKKLLQNTYIVPLAFATLVYSGQLVLFLFTPLSVEAVLLTGYARGVLHLLPLFIFSGVLLWNARFTKDV